MSIEKIINNFKIKGELINYLPYGSGHINDTFLIECSTNQGINRYILQKININIFTNPERLMRNIDIVSNHIKSKLKTEGFEDIKRKTLSVIRTNKEELYAKENNEYWRIYDYIDGGITYNNTNDIIVLYEAAASFGRFLRFVKDLSSEKIKEIIPNFHNTEFRYAQLLNAVKKNIKKRVKKSKNEIDFLSTNKNRFKDLEKQIDEGIFPLRITHNDTKINNVIIDKNTGKGLAVIDLDTVMQGYSFFDFGDLIRTSVSNTYEDENNTDKIYADKERFRAITRGFLSETRSFLLKSEINNLVSGGIIMTMMIGMRFLTDYLNGDKYFKIKTPNHNLIRAKAQFKLADSMINQENELYRIVMEEVK